LNVDVRVVANAKRAMIKKSEGFLKVYLTVPAVEGKANRALIEILADYFHVSKSRVVIIKGLKSKVKTVRISGDFS